MNSEQVANTSTSARESDREESSSEIDVVANDADFNPSPPASPDSLESPPRTTGIHSQTLQCVLQSDADEVLSNTNVSPTTEASVADASPSSETHYRMRPLTRGEARAMGVVVRPALAQNWRDIDKPYFL